MEKSVNIFQFLNKSVSSAGTAERLDAFYLRDGFTVHLVNPIGNDGNFYLGSTKALAEAKQKTVEPGQSVPMKISNTALIWVDADNTTDELEVYVGDQVAAITPDFN